MEVIQEGELSISIRTPMTAYEYRGVTEEVTELMRELGLECTIDNQANGDLVEVG